MTEKSYTKLKKLSDKKKEIEFEAEITNEALEKSTTRVMADVSSKIQMPGFRKGKVSPDMAKKYVNEMEILEDAAGDALRLAIREIIIDENLSIIGAPQITITKIALGSPVEFKVKLAIYPEINLPDYKKIGTEIFGKDKKVEVSDTEVSEAIERIQKIFSAGMNGGNVEKQAALPEINDEFVKQLGPFKNVEEFKTEIKRQLLEEKGINAKRMKEDEVINEIIKKSKIEIPEMLMDQELDHFKYQRNADLEQSGITLENYLKEIKKTEKELEKEEKDFIEKQMRTRFIISEIQKNEKLEIGEHEVYEMAEHLKASYPERDENYLRRMAEAIILNEKLFSVLGEKKNRE